MVESVNVSMADEVSSDKNVMEFITLINDWALLGDISSSALI